MSFEGKPSVDLFNEPFPTRLRDLMEKHGDSNSSLGKAITVSHVSIGAYCTGKQTPSIDIARKIALHYKTSLDFLSGISDEPSINPDIQSIHQYTGLSELAVKHLHSMHLGTEPSEFHTERISQLTQLHIDLYNALLEDEEIHRVIDTYLPYWAEVTKLSPSDFSPKDFPFIFEDQEDALRYYEFRISEIIHAVVHRFYLNHYEDYLNINDRNNVTPGLSIEMEKE